MMGRQVLLIGAGNPMCGDDAAGINVATRLAQTLGDAVSVETDARALWDVVEGTRRPDLLVIVDAALATDGLPVGSWRRIRFPEEADLLDEQTFRNTHSLNLRSALELARTLDTLPAEVWVCGVAGREFAVGASPSPEVEAAVDRLAKELYTRLRSCNVAGAV